MKPISVVVNARTGSSRAKRKLVRPFAGTTLLDIALEKLNALGFFAHRFVATAEDEIRDKARGYPEVQILERAAASVAPGPHPPMVTFEHYTRVPTESIFVVNPCSAFLSVETIRLAFDRFQASDARTAIAVIPTREWVFSPSGAPLTHKDPNALQNTSSGEPHFKASQAFYIMNRDHFTRTGGQIWTLTPGDPLLIEMPVAEAHDVDTDLEFDYAEYLYSRRAKDGAR